MPFTEEQKRRALVDNGYDPEQFDIDDQGYTIERQKAPPATAATEIQHTPPQTSAKGAFGRSFGAALAPTLAGLATSAATLGVAETATGVGAPVGIPTLALAGLLGAGASWAAAKGQEKLMPESWKEQLAADAEQHPIAANLGSLAPNIVAFRPNTPANLVKTVRGFIPGQIDDAARFAAKDAAINTGINLGVGAGMRTMEGGDALDPSGVAWDAAGALAFGRARNNALTRGLKLHPGIDEVNLAELVDSAQQDQRPAFEPVAPEAPAPTLRTWDFDIHGREKEIKAARNVVDKELAGRKVDDATYESMLVDASDKLRGEGKLKTSNPVVDKLTGELKARKEAEKIAQEESKLEQERIAREEKLKSQFLSPEEAAAQNSALEQERIINEARARRREELKREVDAENAQLEQEVATAAEERRLRREQLKREVEADNAALAEEERIAREEAMRQRQMAQEAKAQEEVVTTPAEPTQEDRLKQFQDEQYKKYQDYRKQEIADKTAKNVAEGQSKSKLRTTPEWMGRTSESRTEAPDVAVDQRRQDSREQALTKGFVDIFKNHFAPLHGDKLVAGEPKPGVKGFVKDGEATYTPAATQDTLPHELFGHTFIDKALADPRGKKIVGQLMAEIEASPDYARWRDEAVAGGKVDPSAKEYAAQLLGQRLAGDLAGPKYKTTETVKYQLNILKRELKRIFGRATQDDIAELVQNAYVMGSRMRPAVGGKTDYQLDRSDREVREAKMKAQEKGLRYVEPARFSGIAKDFESYHNELVSLTDKFSGGEFQAKSIELLHKHKIYSQIILDNFESSYKQAYNKLLTAHPEYFDSTGKIPYSAAYEANVNQWRDKINSEIVVTDSSTHKLNAFEKTRYEKELDASLGTKEERAALIARAKEAGFIPVPVWHGSTEKFNAFDPGALGENTKATSATLGHFFSSNSKDAANYGNPKAYFLKAEKPFVYDMRGQAWGQDSKITNRIKKAFADGHDVVVFKNFRDPGGKYGEPATHYVVKEGLENHIKSAETMTDSGDPSLIKQDLLFEKKQLENQIQELKKQYANDTSTDKAAFKARIDNRIKELNALLVDLGENIPLSSRFDTSTTDTRYSREDAPIVGSGLSRIRELGPGGEYLGDKLEANAQDQQLLNGRFRNPVSEVLREFSNENATKIDALVSQEGGFVPPKFKKAVATIKKALQDTHDEQRARDLQVKEFDSKGNVKQRPAEDKVGYNPSVAGTHVYDELINNPESAEAASLRKDFIDYFTAEFSDATDPKAKAEERLRQMFPRKGGGVGVDYNAVRLAEGHGLPESWKEKNIANKWYRYFSKFGADLAYYKNLQSDPAIRTLLNINEDGRGGSAKADTLPDGTDIRHVNYQSNPHVIGALHDAVGGRQLLPSQMLSYSKLANAVTLGPVGKVRDLATVVPIAMELVGPWEVIKALPKAVMSTAEGIAKAKERGIINTRSATWHENLDNLDTMVDRAADTINHYTGAQKLEQVNRGFSWALGRTIAESMQNDPSFVKKFGGKKDVESLADRITENIQGTYDFRGTPTWIRESSFGPLFALNRWSIERFNNWKRNVFDEARDGNLKPLLGNMFGVLLGSALVDELNETIRGKKPDHLSWSEWLALDGEDSAYKLAAALSTSSTTGVLGDIVYSAHQLAAGKPPRGTGMPMLEIASNVSERLGQMVQAGSLDFAQLAVQLAKDNIQIVRDLIPADPKADERRDVRIYKRVVEDKPTPFINANPFENATEKELRDATPEDFAALLPKVVQDIVKTSRNPAKDIESLKRSLSRGDNSFVEDNKFYQMLVKLRGEREAKERLIKYLGEKALREAKSGALGGGGKNG